MSHHKQLSPTALEFTSASKPNHHHRGSGELTTVQALVFPSDERPPHLVSLTTSPLAVGHSAEPYRCGRMPHPEVYMDYVAEGLGPRAWQYEIVDSLEGMSRKFPSPYIIFYPVISRDGMAFPVNKFVREWQGRFWNEDDAWRGNLIVAKYTDHGFTSMMDISMADFPILKNWLATHERT